MAYAVLTREPIDEYGAPLAQLGLEAIAMPVTRYAPPADPHALARALDDGRYDHVFVASPRAAEELVRAASGRALVGVWAVGPGTLRVLEAAGIAAHHPAGVRHGADLARAMVSALEDHSSARVLVPRALDARREPLAILRSGLQVIDVVAYRTVAVEADDPSVQRGAELLRGGAAAVCAVFAPSQVDALAAIAGELAVMTAQFCAIGDTTAHALRAAGVARVSIASDPTPEGMARAAAAVYPGNHPP